MRSIFIYIIMVSLSIFCAQGAEIEGTDICRLSEKDGLAGMNVYKIYKDRNGLIWLGTSNGLSLYNGLTIKNYRVGKDRSMNDVIDIAQTSDESIFFSTIHGVYMVDLTTDKVKRVLPDIDGFTSALATDGNTLYVGSEKGLFIFDGRKAIHFMLNNDYLSDGNTIKDICVDSLHRVWLVTDYDLYQYKKGSRHISKVNINKRMKFVGKLHTIAISKNTVYIGTTNNGIIAYDITSKWACRYVDVGCKVINSLIADNDNLYVATDGNGAQIVRLKDHKIIKSYTTSTNPRLMDNSLYYFMHDKSGVDWFGFFKLGVAYTYYVNKMFDVYHYGTFSTKGMIVRSFCINGEQKAIGTRNGLYLVDQSRNRINYYGEKQLGGKIVTSVCYYDSHYYISTYDGGISVLDAVNQKVSRMRNISEFNYGSFGVITLSPDKKLFMGSNFGLFVYDPKDKTVIKYDYHNSQLYDGYINDLQFDRIGRCWINTKKGISLYTTYVTNYLFPKGFFNDKKSQVCTMGHNGDLLFYSEDGLFITDDSMSKFGKINLMDKIGTEVLDCVVYDRKGHYWVNTDKGLFMLDVNFKTLRYFGSDYNVDDMMVTSSKCLVDAKGTLWMGTTNGLMFADLWTAEKKYNSDFDIIPYDARVNDHLLSVADDYALLRKKTLNLTWNIVSETLTFKPLLLNYGHQGGRYFEYRLDNDDKWTSVSESGLIKCRMIGIGIHKLHVRAAYGSHLTTYTILVRPSVLSILELMMLIAIGLFGWMIVTRKVSVDVKMKSKRNEEEEKLLFEKLKRYMEKERPYLNQSLKLSDLADVLECTTFLLSQVLKLHGNSSYYGFINSYRIKEFKRMMKELNYKVENVTDVAEKCGFRRSSFFATFKKIEGFTPAEYIKHQVTKPQ